eukprot:CAMPEP_0119478962 /NCGR_PEP_ID=MMETSP1344-20130328/8457_1 /TAXON_ID=236787 /ORGANISM="Florenciella parvula, Strain CCMP2471" /LENGTH=340 /DNA_ID=CAMNT_0007513173 /DNA_START=362 /DNA_END=1385 /DNA_ORIENTATION=+
MSSGDANTWDAVRKSVKKSLASGMAGGSAMFFQVLFLMPLDTTVTYQYRYGLTNSKALAALLGHKAGWRRLYMGIGPALAQGPLSRFGDTAANAGVISMLQHSPATRDLPLVLQTFLGSATAASWRVALMPLDVWKTILQVKGGNGHHELRERVRLQGPRSLYFGGVAAFMSSLCGHLPWYTTYNWLQVKLPQLEPGAGVVEKALRNGFIGFSASVVSDCCTNWLRIVKSIRQAEGISYSSAVGLVMRTDGVAGLLGRGLKTRILANGIQALIFTALWKHLEEALEIQLDVADEPAPRSIQADHVEGEGTQGQGAAVPPLEDSGGGLGRWVESLGRARVS